MAVTQARSTSGETVSRGGQDDRADLTPPTSPAVDTVCYARPRIPWTCSRRSGTPRAWQGRSRSSASRSAAQKGVAGARNHRAIEFAHPQAIEQSLLRDGTDGERVAVGDDATVRRDEDEPAMRDLGPNVRVISGRADGLSGTVGGPRRFDFAALIPDFGRSLESLLELNLGSSAEI